MGSEKRGSCAKVRPNAAAARLGRAVPSGPPRPPRAEGRGLWVSPPPSWLWHPPIDSLPRGILSPPPAQHPHHTSTHHPPYPAVLSLATLAQGCPTSSLLAKLTPPAPGHSPRTGSPLRECRPVIPRGFQTRRAWPPRHPSAYPERPARVPELGLHGCMPGRRQAPRIRTSAAPPCPLFSSRMLGCAGHRGWVRGLRG